MIKIVGALIHQKNHCHIALGRSKTTITMKLQTFWCGKPIGPEFNVKTDIPSAQKLVAEWPGPVYWSGYEVGSTIKYPARSIERDFGPPGANPVADAYRNYLPMPYDRETWDLTAALYAVRPADGYFTVSAPGLVTVDAQGKTAFTPQEGGQHHVLSVNDAQRARILEAFLWLCTQPAEAR